MSPAARETSDAYLERCLAVLEAFDARHRELTVGQLSDRSGLPTSTTYRLVTTLERMGLVERREGYVSLGMRLFELGQVAARRSTLRDVALPYIADLRAATRQTVHLAVLDGYEVVYLEIVRAEDGPVMPSRVGGRLPAWATAVGKSLLATMTVDEVDALLPDELTPVGPSTITDRDELHKHLARVRRNGIALEEQESGRGIVCAASAVVGPDGRAVGAVSASGWVRRMDLRRIAPAVHTCALGISRQVGKVRLPN
ncbi:IclR family transcriptional regulator [Nocardioides sp. GY 10127]|uniref:IclR family transcriptional regulator n=1 Tax=Nocardioides sp. GY 10127 TaxID=2569762 RepID=UPI0010A8A4C1|nr:IclR family transcriptional regulator [Nocardioides sp. GY 10127]TIC81760.1 IclR family transcriptional regulator [Nocardioides sp. GY 10127]